MNKPEVTESSGNVFLDLGFPEEEAKESLAKAKLVLVIHRMMKKAGWTQERTAEMIGMKQPRVSAMLRGDFRNISEAKLLDCIMKLGCDVKITITSRTAGRTKARRQGRLEIVGA
jgi:predicted XRE-type DNA-binding protein